MKQWYYPLIFFGNSIAKYSGEVIDHFSSIIINRVYNEPVIISDIAIPAINTIIPIKIYRGSRLYIYLSFIIQLSNI